MIQTILEDGDIEVKNLKTENYSGNTYSGNTMEILGGFHPIEHTSKNISTIQKIISKFMIQKQTPAPMV